MFEMVDEPNVNNITFDESTDNNEHNVDEITVDKITVDEITVDEIPVDEIPVDEVTVDESFTEVPLAATTLNDDPLVDNSLKEVPLTYKPLRDELFIEKPLIATNAPFTPGKHSRDKRFCKLIKYFSNCSKHI